MTYKQLGSPAAISGDVVEKEIYVPADPNSLAPVDLVRRWLENCTSKHTKCQRSFVGGYVESQADGIAPQRLLHITSTPESSVPTVRLVDAGCHFQSPYVALSHCWGTPGKRPICTVKENIEIHKAQVPWSRLSQTFKDACTLCFGLGIHYLWIDSLCIVQDDPADWKQEASIMGRIYEEATFTIAASSAADSSQGLFGVRAANMFAELPYHQDQMEKKGSIYAYMPLGSPGLTIERSPLNERAWVLQEYVLSRRTAHFTKQGVIWSCGRDPAATRDEFDGGGSHVVPNTWVAMIRDYSKRKLTFKTDKLVAIQGLASSWSRRYRKTYYNGVFLEDMPHCLRWSWSGMTDERLVRDVGNDIPSWSWASTTGSVDFDTPEGSVSSTPVYKDIRPSDVVVGGLTFKAAIKEVTSFKGSFDCLPTTRYESLRAVDCDSASQPGPRSWCNHSNHVEMYYLLLDASEQNIGWGLFDETPPASGSIYCLPLVKESMRKWYEPPGDTSEPFYLWSLLLQRTQEVNVYKRVGYGGVCPPSWVEDERPQVIHLA